MEITHDAVNSVLIAIMAIAFVYQASIVKYMKTAMDAVNPQKIIDAQKIIDQGKDWELKLKLSHKTQEITREAGRQFQEVNKTFLDQYNELINVPFGILKDKDWEYREAFLLKLPKNADVIRSILQAYDNGDFSFVDQKTEA